MPLPKRINELVKERQSLDLNSRRLDASDIEQLMKALSSDECITTSLSLDQNPGLNNEALTELAQQLQLLTTKITSLCIASTGLDLLNEYNEEDSKQGEEALLALLRNPKLKELDVSYNNLGDRGAELIADHTLQQKLYLARIRIKDWKILGRIDKKTAENKQADKDVESAKVHIGSGGYPGTLFTGSTGKSVTISRQPSPQPLIPVH